MNRYNYKKIIPLILFTLFAVPLFGQQSNTSKLSGSWSFIKFEFLRTFDDSLEMKDNAAGTVVTFEKNSKFITRKITKDSVSIVDSGSYKLSSDGNKITQNNETGIILLLTEEDLILKIEHEAIVYLKKITAPGKEF